MLTAIKGMTASEICSAFDFDLQKRVPRIRTHQQNLVHSIFLKSLHALHQKLHGSRPKFGTTRDPSVLGFISSPFLTPEMALCSFLLPHPEKHIYNLTNRAVSTLSPSHTMRETRLASPTPFATDRKPCLFRMECPSRSSPTYAISSSFNRYF
jgi:hypothetical protein